MSRTFITTLTKKMAEDLTATKEMGVGKVGMHSDTSTLSGTEINPSDLRLGKPLMFWLGLTLLREGIDVPEVSLRVLDADKEAFFATNAVLSRLLTAAQNSEGHVIKCMDTMTQ